jgi:hypothetical protein
MSAQALEPSSADVHTLTASWLTYVRGEREDARMKHYLPHPARCFCVRRQQAQTGTAEMEVVFLIQLFCLYRSSILSVPIDCTLPPYNIPSVLILCPFP